WALFGLFALAGLGNSVFHPADYAIMAARLEDSVFGRAVSIHTFTGYLGWAAAAVTMLPLATVIGWRSALAVVGVVGLLIVGVMVASARHLGGAPRPRPRRSRGGRGAHSGSGLAAMTTKP